MQSMSISGHSALWWSGIVVLGLVVGVVSGMFGVGGNFLLIPLLNVGFGVPLPLAVGTSLCQVIGASSGALMRHTRLNQRESLIDWIMMGGALVGTFFGAGTLAWLSRMGIVTLFGHRLTAVKLVLSLTFSVILFLVAIGIARDVRNRPANAPLGPGPLTRIRLDPVVILPRSGRTVSILVLSYLGLALGFLNGLVGMGGGVVLLPILVYGIGMRMQMAAGTGILLLVVSAMMGTYAHAMLGHVHLGLAVTLLAGSTVGAPIGATITSCFDGRKLRAIFAGTVCATALAVLWDLLRRLVG